MKKLFIALIAIAIVIGAFFALNSYIYNAKQGESGVSSDLVAYFAERIATLGVKDIGQPIEGFDAQLIMTAFPGFLPSDFADVQTLEGHYELRNNAAIFVRDKAQPVSSAEQTLSQKGYGTLLENVSARFGVTVTDKVAVDALIDSLNTAERVTTRIDQSAEAFGIKIVPHEVIDDSRCPKDVTCVWAGTAHVRTTLTEATTTKEQMFELGKPVTTNSGIATLLRVDPTPTEGQKIAADQYVFVFEITKK